MTNKRLKPEEIVSKLRQVEVLMGQGLSRLDAIRRSSSARPCGNCRCVDLCWPHTRQTRRSDTFTWQCT